MNEKMEDWLTHTQEMITNENKFYYQALGPDPFDNSDANVERNNGIINTFSAKIKGMLQELSLLADLMDKLSSMRKNEIATKG